MIHRARRARSAKLARLGAFVCLAIASTSASCRAPTEVTIDIVGEVPYRDGMRVAVQVASAGGAENAPIKTEANRAWPYGGSIGTVVLGPSGESRDADVRVVLAIDREPSTCSAADSKGCVVQRRRVSFVDGQGSEVRLVLRAACLGVFCDAGTACRADKSCGPIDSDEPGAPPAGTPSEGTDAYARAVLADRPRHYYRFDEAPGATSARDEMGRANGTYDGPVKLGVTGALDASPATGAYFDGRGSKVLVPALEDMPGALSIEAWVRSDSPEGDTPTVAERLDQGRDGALFGYRLSVPPTFEAKLELFRGSEVVIAKVPRLRNFGAGYTHIAAVAHAGRVRVYVNGKLSTDTSYRDAPPPPVVSPFIVGSGSAGPFRGAIDEVAVYDYPLSLEAIGSHLQASGTKVTP